MLKNFICSFVGFKCLVLMFFLGSGSSFSKSFGPDYVYPSYLVTSEQKEEFRKVVSQYLLPADMRAQFTEQDFKQNTTVSERWQPYCIEKEVKVWDKGPDINRLANAECMREVIDQNNLDDKFSVSKKWLHYIGGMWRVLAENVDNNISNTSLWSTDNCFPDLFKLTEVTGYTDWYSNTRITSEDKLSIIDTDDMAFYGNKKEIDWHTLQRCGLAKENSCYAFNCKAMLMLNTALLGIGSERIVNYLTNSSARKYIEDLFAHQDMNEMIWSLPWQNISSNGIEWHKIRDMKVLDKYKKDVIKNFTRQRFYSKWRREIRIAKKVVVVVIISLVVRGVKKYFASKNSVEEEEKQESGCAT